MTVRQLLSASYAHLASHVGWEKAEELLTPPAANGGRPDPASEARENQQAVSLLSELALLPRAGK